MYLWILKPFIKKKWQKMSVAKKKFTSYYISVQLLFFIFAKFLKIEKNRKKMKTYFFRIRLMHYASKYKKLLSTLHYNQYNRDFFSKLCASCRVYKLRISWDIKNNNVASVLKGQIFKNYKLFQCGLWIHFFYNYKV